MCLDAVITFFSPAFRLYLFARTYVQESDMDGGEKAEAPLFSPPPLLPFLAQAEFKGHFSFFLPCHSPGPFLPILLPASLNFSASSSSLPNSGAL